MRVAAFAPIVVLSACEQTPGELTTSLDAELPANANVIVFARPPIDVTFARVDRGEVEPLPHNQIGSGASAEDLALFILPGEDVAGDTITIQADCDGCRAATGDIVFREDDDVTPPAIEDGPLELSALGLRSSPFDLFVSRYEVTLVTPRFTDESPVFFLLTGTDFTVLRQPNGDGTGFVVDYGLGGNICMRIALIDAARNETVLSDEECVVLDPSTAP